MTISTTCLPDFTGTTFVKQALVEMVGDASVLSRPPVTADFARLTAPGGFWDEQVAQLGLANLMGTRGDVLSRILTSALVKDRLEERFAAFAIDASFRAAPVVTDAIQMIGFDNAIALVAKVVPAPRPEDRDLALAKAQDVLLAKGEKWVGNEGHGLIHRSPQPPAGEQRLLLTLDWLG